MINEVAFVPLKKRLTALSRYQQHGHMLNSYVLQLTTNIFKGQCCHLIDSDDVAIVFPR
jgi:hypothetical protein